MIDYSKVLKLESHDVVLSEIFSELSNTLLVAPTGSGKSILALRTIEQLFLKDEKSKHLILLPTNLLLDQFYMSYKDYVYCEVEKISTRLPIKHATIHLATIHTICVLVKNNKINLKDYTSIHIDEIHKWKNSAMSKVIKDNCQDTLIIGYTATPGILKDYKTFGISKLVTLKCVQKWKRELKMKELLLNEKVKIKKDILDSLITKKYKFFFKVLDLDYGLDQFNYLAYFVKESAKILTKLKNNAYLISCYYELISVLHLRNLYFFEDYITCREYYERKPKLCKNLKNKLLFEHLWIPSEYINTKFLFLLELLNKLSENSKMIVFFENYTTLKTTKEFLKKYVKDVSSIEILSGKQKVTQKERNISIKKIREDSVKIILCTSVAEEGLDIGSADLVVFYKPITNITRLIQRFGRTGRHKDGKVIVLYYKDTLEKKLMAKIEKNVYKYDRKMFSKYET